MGLLSMTGFGRYEEELKTGSYKIEIKTVNNRYLDVQFRMPRLFNSLEQKIKKLLSEKLIRGSVHFNINWSAPEEQLSVVYDSNTAKKYVNILKEISSDFDLASQPSVSDLSPFYKDFISQELLEFSAEELWSDLEGIVTKTVELVNIERVREGNFTTEELLSVVDKIEENLLKVSNEAPSRLTRYNDRLKKAVSELKGEGVDESRIAFEMTLMAEKLDIAEEITRMKAHIIGMRDLLNGSGATGKRMGFLLQEMNRECNTIGSKANDSTIAAIVVELKELVEQIREQSLNLV